MALLNTFQQTHTPKILTELDHFFDIEMDKAKAKDDCLVDMVSVLKEFTLRGGKRLRPLLVVLSFQLAQHFHPDSRPQSDERPREIPLSIGNIYRVAAAVEVHHHYLLNLDDMADRDVLRHGGKTLEEFYKTELFKDWKDQDHHAHTFSSIAGALLSSYTIELMRTSEFDPIKILTALGTVTQILFADTVTGWDVQYLQNNQDIESASQERFLKGLEYVTSKYTFTGPLLIGAQLVFELSDPLYTQLTHALREYGKHVGIAFQIQDDIMGLFGDPEKMGKAVGNDVREGKKTLLMQQAYHRGSQEDKEFIRQCLHSPLSEDQLKKLQKLVTDSGSLEYSKQLAQQHIDIAHEMLNGLFTQVDEIQVLHELADYVIARNV